MAASKVVQIYYDVLSPYSWIGFEVLCRYRQRWNIDLRFCPFFLAGIMQGADNQPPGMVPAKARYMGTDLKRLSSYYQIPLAFPKDWKQVLFDKGSLVPMRLLVSANLTCPQHVEMLSRHLWMKIWSRDEDIVAEDSLREVCRSAGLEGDLVDNLIGQIQMPAVKDELKRTTQEALDLGAFGAPFIVAHVNGKKESFFGSDRFELLAHTLGEKWEGPLLEYAAKL